MPLTTEHCGSKFLYVFTHMSMTTTGEAFCVWECVRLLFLESHFCSKRWQEEDPPPSAPPFFILPFSLHLSACALTISPSFLSLSTCTCLSFYPPHQAFTEGHASFYFICMMMFLICTIPPQNKSCAHLPKSVQTSRYFISYNIAPQ